MYCPIPGTGVVISPVQTHWDQPWPQHCQQQCRMCLAWEGNTELGGYLPPGKVGWEWECEWTTDSQHWSTVLKLCKKLCSALQLMMSCAWLNEVKWVHKIWSCLPLTLFHPGILTLSTALTGLCLFSQRLIMSKFSELQCFGLMKQWQLQLSMSQFVRRGTENNPASVWLCNWKSFQSPCVKQVLLQNWVFCPIPVFV